MGSFLVPIFAAPESMRSVPGPAWVFSERCGLAGCGASGLGRRAASELCAFPFQLEKGGDMAHVRDFATQAVRFGLIFYQVPTSGPPAVAG